MDHKLKILVILILGILFPSILFAATTGKVAGKIVDEETGEPLPGVNVVIEGTTMGGATDIEGDYFIINVPPGRYSLVASYIGYERMRKTDVIVQIDRTIRVDFALSASVIEGEEVTVVAEREVVKQDVAHSEFSISEEVVVNTPSVRNLEDAVLLQAGIDWGGSFVPSEKGDGMGFEGISIRGGMVSETEWRVDGMSTSDRRRDGVQGNKISLTSVQEIQVLAGGFNAEYGDIRSGVINVVTKTPTGGSGAPSLNGSAFIKYTPSHRKHWGEDYYDFTNPRSILYPYLGPYAMDGFSWEGEEIWGGWNQYASNLDPEHPYYNRPDLARQQFAYEHRPQPYANDPDINVDATLTGPIPFLKNAGFMLSHINDRIDYPYPSPREIHSDHSTNLKLMYNPTSDLKIMVNGQYGEMSTISSAFNDIKPGSYWLIENPAKRYTLNNQAFNVAGHTLVDHIRRRFAARVTKVFSPSTYMEVNVQRVVNSYYAYHDRLRDTTAVVNIGGIGFDERPYGWFGGFRVKDQLGYYVAGHGTRRDRSWMKSWNVRASLVSQVNKYNQVKAGIEINRDDIHQRFGQNRAEKGQIHSFWYDETPILASAYLQDKLEFQGMIANVGIRMDYSKAADEWFNPSDPFSPWFDRGMVSYTEINNYATQIDSFQYAPKSAVNAKLAFSPRIGVSHPISQNSKLFFNYGHFYQRASYDWLFREHWYARPYEGRLEEYGNPNLDLEKTVAYELGFEQNIMDQFSLRVAGYYKDITNELIWINYRNSTGSIRYDQPDNNGYRDIRGFEISVEKRAGRFITGFLNYDYMVRSSGRIGANRIYEDPTVAPRIYDPAQKQPVARPKFRASLNFTTPDDQFGPQIAGFYPLAFFNANILFRWEAGHHFTYNPEQREGVENNMQWVDFRNTDLQIGKGFYIGKTTWLRAFVEVRNLLNNKFILYAPNNENIPNSRWDAYLGSLKEGDRVGEWDTEEKPYLDMPRMEQLLFTNMPRTITFGLRFGF